MYFRNACLVIDSVSFLTNKAGFALSVVGSMILGVGIPSPYWLRNDFLKMDMGALYTCTDGVCELDSDSGKLV